MIRDPRERSPELGRCWFSTPHRWASQETLPGTRVSHVIDSIDATFDDSNLVANAGLLLVATLSQRLGLEALIDATVRLVGRVGGARPGRKVLTLVHSLIAGGSHIDHADVLGLLRRAPCWGIG